MEGPIPVKPDESGMMSEGGKFFDRSSNSNLREIWLAEELQYPQAAGQEERRFSTCEELKLLDKPRL